MLVKTIFILLLITLIFWYPSIDFSFSLLIIPLINVSWSIHSVLDPFWFLSSFWKLRFWSLSTLFLRACINSSSSFSMINSFPWLGFMCISLLSLSLSLPRFAFLNDSAFSKLLMGLTAFLLNGMTDTPSLPVAAVRFDFFQGCFCYWSFISVGWLFWLASFFCLSSHCRFCSIIFHLLSPSVDHICP